MQTEITYVHVTRLVISKAQAFLNLIVYKINV